jgi:hypothetical protein
LFALDRLYSHFGEYPIFYVQTTDEWINEISEGTSLASKIVNSILKDMTFDTKNPNLGIQIQPFIEITKSELAIVPSIILFNNFERNFFDLQCKLNKKSYDALSNEKEHLMLDEIESILKVKRGLLFKELINIKSKGIKTNIDLAVLDPETGNLYLIQLKWLLKAKNLLESFEKEKEIAVGVMQSQKTVEYVTTNLEGFLSAYFPKMPTALIKKIQPLIICRGNLGTKIGHHSKDYLLDYDVFKLFFKLRNCNLLDIVSLIENRTWLPEQNYEYKIKQSELSIDKYKMRIPGFQLEQTSSGSGISDMKKLNDYFRSFSS